MNFMTDEFKTHIDNVKNEFDKQIQKLIKKTDTILDKLTAFNNDDSPDPPPPTVNKTLLDIERKINELQDSVKEDPIESDKSLED